jgi:hypothetical protein
MSDTTPDYAIRLRTAVDDATPRLLALDEAAVARRPAPGRWSPKEIIGHLIDSAGNNHQRFVRAASQNDLVFSGYAQDEWVVLQRYQEAPWEELVLLWQLFNRHIARVMAAIPAERRLRVEQRHNFHQIGFRTVPESQPTTLEYFMNDYVDHLEHHLAQVLA